MSRTRSTITVAAAIANLQKLDQTLSVQYDALVFANGVSEIQVKVQLSKATATVTPIKPKSIVNTLITKFHD